MSIKKHYLALLVFIMSNKVMANSLETAARTLGQKTIGVAQSLCLFGLACGAVMTLIPWTRHWGTHVLQASGVGMLVSYGAPAIIEFLNSAF